MSIAVVTSQNGPNFKNSKEYFKKFGSKANESTIEAITNMIIVNFYNHVYLNKFFGKEDRVTFRPENKKKTTASKTEKEVREFLETIGMTIDSYIQGTCSFIDKEKDNRQYRIGRILTRNKQNSMSAMFQNDNTRQSTKSPYLLTISRNPFDISMMSTFRGWTSCMSIGSCNSQYVSNDLTRGTLIIYAHKEDDMDIVSPMCRVLLKPYYYIHNNSRKVVYAVSARTYGQTPSHFIENANKICNELNSKLVNRNTFVINADRCSTLYNDGEDQSIIKVIDEDKFIKTFSRNISKYGKKIYKKVNDLNISDENKIDIYLRIYRKYGSFPFPQKYADMNDDLKSILTIYNFKNDMSRQFVNMGKYKKIDKKSKVYQNIKGLLNDGLHDEHKIETSCIYKFTNLFTLSMIVNYKTSEYIDKFKKIEKFERSVNSGYITGFVEYVKQNVGIKRIKNRLSNVTIDNPSHNYFRSFFNPQQIKIIDKNFNNNKSKLIEYITKYNEIDMTKSTAFKEMREMEEKIIVDLFESDSKVFEKLLTMVDKNQRNVVDIIKNGICFNRAFAMLKMKDVNIPEECVDVCNNLKKLCSKIYGDDFYTGIKGTKTFQHIKSKVIAKLAKNVTLTKDQNNDLDKKIYDNVYCISTHYHTYLYDMIRNINNINILSYVLTHCFSIRGIRGRANMSF